MLSIELNLLFILSAISETKGSKGPDTLSSMCSNFVDICADNKIPGQRKLRFSNSGLQTFGSENSKQRQTMCGCGVSQSSLCDHMKHKESQSTCQSLSDSAEYLRHSQRQWHDFKLLEEKLVYNAQFFNLHLGLHILYYIFVQIKIMLIEQQK